MSFRTLAISASRTTFVQPPTFSLLRGIPLAAVRWNSSTASGWLDRKPNYIILNPRIRSMLESTENLSYTQKLEKLREGLADNSDLQSTNIALTNIPTFVTVERVTEYVNKFGTAVKCYPSEFPVLNPSVEKTGRRKLLPCVMFEASRKLTRESTSTCRSLPSTVLFSPRGEKSCRDYKLCD